MEDRMRLRSIAGISSYPLKFDEAIPTYTCPTLRMVSRFQPQVSKQFKERIHHNNTH